MKPLVKLVRQNPAIAVGTAVFLGLALGAGWVPLPSIGGILPAKAAPAPATPPPPPDPLSY